MISFVAEINFSEFAYACFNRCISSSICGKDLSISTKKSTLNSYSNPQSILARLHSSDGSKRLLAEWWQIEMQKTALLAHCLSICLEVLNEDHSNSTSNLSLEQVRHNIRIIQIQRGHIT